MTINVRSGAKLYDNDWHARHGLCEEALADRLAALNLSYVISQSRYLPMEDSAVPSRRGAGTGPDDRLLREHLRDRNIAYIGVLNICFDPTWAGAHPDKAAIDQHGKPHEKVDWYHGVPPDRTGNLAEKEALLRAGVRALDPDGIHLGFVRWPGFWETWLPGDQRVDKLEYGYSRQTLTRFAETHGLDLPVEDPVVAARLIGQGQREAFTSFKCRATHDAIARLRSAVREERPGTEISINTLPFFAGDFQGCVTEVFGQDVEMLADTVDTFEVMSYHQIMGRDAGWPAAVTEDIKARSGGRAISTIQAAPLYLEGMHAGRGRSPALDALEFAMTLDALEPSTADGVCIFTFTQMLDRAGTADGARMLERLRRFRT